MITTRKRDKTSFLHQHFRDPGYLGRYEDQHPDTPGYFDFVGEAEEAVSVADAAIIVVSSKADRGRNEESMGDVRNTNFRIMVFVTDMDIDEVS